MKKVENPLITWITLEVAKSTKITKIPPKPAYLNETQTHPIINWVKWVLTQLNPININVYWVLNGYPIRPNYDASIISTNQQTLKYPKNPKKRLK